MEPHYSFSDDQFIEALEKATLEPHLFTHEAHLRWGWLLLERYGINEGRIRACRLLRQFTSAIGEADKYNETVTIAAINAIHHFRLRSSAINFRNFIKENPRLKTAFKELMATHYSGDIFSSEAGRQKYQEPDLRPFD